MLPNTFYDYASKVYKTCVRGCSSRGFHAASTGLSKTFTTGTNHRLLSSVSLSLLLPFRELFESRSQKERGFDTNPRLQILVKG